MSIKTSVGAFFLAPDGFRFTPGVATPSVNTRGFGVERLGNSLAVWVGASERVEVLAEYFPFLRPADSMGWSHFAVVETEFDGPIYLSNGNGRPAGRRRPLLVGPGLFQVQVRMEPAATWKASVAERGGDTDGEEFFDQYLIDISPIGPIDQGAIEGGHSNAELERVSAVGHPQSRHINSCDGFYVLFNSSISFDDVFDFVGGDEVRILPIEGAVAITTHAAWEDVRVSVESREQPLPATQREGWDSYTESVVRLIDGRLTLADEEYDPGEVPLVLSCTPGPNLFQVLSRLVHGDGGEEVEEHFVALSPIH
ncbi:hypothetical protein [Nocardioides sp. Kera G14]|uniref:hypothetical protein n=1 Tax=Nocardioides sp. Kera G14 TaxID=2884264 RepID=UPI001D110B2E|nr:hypothetical protein [Nocardioides sp. Kera G14]UDY24193.1 hypothetical protein LH076_02535 [Nocardioides sp. Kera G14]